MAECGAWVYCVARSEDKLASLVEEIEASGGEAAYRAVSLRGADEIRATVAAMVEEMGGIDRGSWSSTSPPATCSAARPARRSRPTAAAR
jgi:NAD(P)-dependent dehydrogenase (short-subunit alcohol dehydrogenase family)